MDPDAAVVEYNSLFVGVGKSEVNLHASHWLTGFMMEKPLADVRAALARLGLGRRPGVSLVEDHLAALLETMRILVAGQDGDIALAAQLLGQPFGGLGAGGVLVDLSQASGSTAKDGTDLKPLPRLPWR